MNKSTKKFLIITLILTSPIWGFMLYVMLIRPVYWRYSVKAESIHLLESAQTEEGLKKVVAGLGLYLSFPDGTWLAIRYEDTHSGPLSSSVVLTSAGDWYEDDYHYCGTFSAYLGYFEKAGRKDWLIEEFGDIEAGMKASGFGELHAMATSQNLKTACVKLQAMGFWKMER